MEIGEGELAFGRDIRRERETLGDSDGNSMRKRERLGDSERKREAWQRWRERGGMRELKPCEKRPQIKYQ